MERKKLYRFIRNDGGITDSLEKPEGVEYAEKIRLIAAKGERLTKDGINLFTVLDLDLADAEAYYFVPYEEGRKYEISDS